MLSLKIRQFKCFKDISVPIANLTVMAGANGVGKSTSIQSLLLLRQTIEQCTTLGSSHYNLLENWKNTLTSLNEYFCLAIGNTGHALYRDFEDNFIDISLIVIYP